MTAAATKKKAEEEAAKKAAEEARRKKAAAAQELEERRRLMAEAVTARSQRGTSPSEMSVTKTRGGTSAGGKERSVEIRMMATMTRRRTERLANGAKARSSLAKCRQARGVQSSWEGGSGERIAVMDSQMAQSLANLRALREADSKTHQYLRQLLRRQEDDHARLIAMETRMAMMGMGEGLATAGPSRRNTGRRRPLKRTRIVEESEEEEEEEEEEKGVEEKENEVEKDGEGEEEETAPTEARSEKGKEKEVVE
ncbi:hypothetical protein F5876DRAFT_82965 [Lentinula aff. lateritia]|uniref:Uncharacterized protein n=1 Tax=Lentinula aff. lateritia TaxID=2804960 RepID=A0ACC1TIZ0_9AGAR|nr:hypothetical protein F5876DRAFT_82965 [Lentinula aff. lateritia]